MNDKGAGLTSEPRGKHGEILQFSGGANRNARISIALLTGGNDKPYTWGLATELEAKGASIDLIGGDDFDSPEFRNCVGINLLNLRGNQRPDAGLLKKISRVWVYYCKLLRYAATAKPKLFHILWNNKFQTFDRTILLLFYKWLNKRIVLTAHNVNASRRDANDTMLNRLTLKIQYNLADHIFVHTQKMKVELMEEFDVNGHKISVIPFGINNSIPTTTMTPVEARVRLGIRPSEKTILFFGHITPYKGLEYLIEAFRGLINAGGEYRLIIAGRPEAASGQNYWNTIQKLICASVPAFNAILRPEHIPDKDIEVYFKAADLLVLPYRHIYQSGVLFLAYNFGLPVIAADVGSLKDEIIEGKTGFVFASEDPIDLMNAMRRYFESDLFTDLASRRQHIREFALERHSWDAVGRTTMSVYGQLLRLSLPSELNGTVPSKNSLRTKALS